MAWRGEGQAPGSSGNKKGQGAQSLYGETGEGLVHALSSLPCLLWLSPGRKNRVGGTPKVSPCPSLQSFKKKSGIKVALEGPISAKSFSVAIAREDVADAGRVFSWGKGLAGPILSQPWYL